MRSDDASCRTMVGATRWRSGGSRRKKEAAAAPASGYYRRLSLSTTRATVLLLLLLAAPAAGFIRHHGVSPRRTRKGGRIALATAAGEDREEPPTAVVIVPGYASDAQQYRRLEASFHQRGLPAYTVPLSSAMWAPTFGGRSIRPILDRLHATVLDVALKARPLPPSQSTDGDDAASYRQQRAGRYSAAAFWAEMADPSRGARFPPPSSSDTGGAMAAAADANGEEDPPPTQEFGREELHYRVALVAHSAGGWISRLYLSNAEYDGRVYNGARFVSTLVTLGSPHVFPPRFRGAAKVPYALRNLQFVNDRCTGAAGGHWEDRVRCVCVGARTIAGGRTLGGLVKDWAGYSYEISGYVDETVWGDGITPLESALGLPGATAKVELEGEVYHGPEVEAKGKAWYGTDPEPLERWIGYVHPDPALWPASSSAAAGAAAGEEEEEEEEATAAERRR